MPTSEIESRQQSIGARSTLILCAKEQVTSLRLPVSRAQYPCLRKPWSARPSAAVPVRSAGEIEGLRQACLVARRILDAAHAAVRPGVTTEEIDRVVSTDSCLGQRSQVMMSAACAMVHPPLTS